MSEHPLKILEWLAEAGADTPLADAPIDRFAESEAARQAMLAGKSRAKSTLSGQSVTLPKGTTSIEERIAALKDARMPLRQTEMTTARLPDEGAVKAAVEIANSAASLEALQKAMENFDGCNLRLTAKNMVFAGGNSSAKIMFVGEAPDRDEDLSGVPFAGMAGELLNRMLESIGLNRERAYFANTIPWRPPGNRPPTQAEMEICKPFIEQHIKLHNPDILVLFGSLPVKMLLKNYNNALKLRGKWISYELENGVKIDTIVTLHPAYLLKQPAQKRQAWQDLLMIKAKLAES